MADDAPGGDAVVVVGGGHGELGDDLQDHEGAVGSLQNDVDVAVQLAVDVGDLPIDPSMGRAPAAGDKRLDAGGPVQPRVGGR